MALPFLGGITSTGLLAPLFKGLGSGFGGGITSGITSGISSLFGDNSGPSQNAKNVHNMRLGSNMGPQPDASEHAATSSPLLEPIQSTAKKDNLLKEKSWKDKALDFGLDLAEKSTTRLVEHMTDRAVSGIFDKSAKQRAIDDWKYDRIRFPGVTPWEINSGSSGGHSMGGQAPAEIAAAGQRTAAGISAGGHTDAAQITTSPQVESIKFKTKPEVEKILSEARLNDQKRLNEAEELPHIKPLREIEKAWKHADTIKNQQQSNVFRDQAKFIRQQILTELQRTDLTKHDKRVREAYAKILRIPRNYQWAADAAFATAILSGSGLLSSGLISRLRNLLPGGSKSPKGKPPLSGGNQRGPYKRTYDDKFTDTRTGEVIGTDTKYGKWIIDHFFRN